MFVILRRVKQYISMAFQEDKRMRVYLDHAATTPCDPAVIRGMKPYFMDTFGNPSSAHWFGREAVKAVDEAREVFAMFLNCSPLEVYFMGSATEADNTAVTGVLRSLGGGQPVQGFLPHAIVSQIEHEAVLEPCRTLEKEGRAEVTYVPVGHDGIVDPRMVGQAIRPTTALVSVMYANSEIGAIQPIAEVGGIIREENERRAEAYKRAKSQSQPKSYQLKAISYPIRFHTDAVQAAQFLDCNVDRLNLDLLTLSAHKIYGPKGIGALYVRRGTPLEPLMKGGGQERGVRAGTENVPFIVGFAEAVRLVGERRDSAEKTITSLRDRLIQGVLEEVPGTLLNGSRNQRLPNNVNILFHGIQGEVALIALDEKGIAVSTGSACASKSLKPSHVLEAIGVDLTKGGALRFSLGRDTTKEEIDYTVKMVKEVVEKLRSRNSKH